MSVAVHESVAGDPHPALAGLVDRYIGYRLEGFEPGVHFGLPSGTLTFVLALDEPLHLLEAPDPTAVAGDYDVLIGGLHDRRALIRHDGYQRGIQVGLHPLGARRLLGVPASALAQQVVSLDDLLGALAGELHEQVSAAASWPARFAAIDRVLLRRVEADGPSVRSELVWSWGQLCRSGGRVGVAELADEIGWSRRHFTSQFAAEVGLAPKTVARMFRFDRARHMLQQAVRPGLAHVAAACGYADQAHLTREFRAIVDCTPTQLFLSDPTLASAIEPVA
jgi:AraC-like DNA-binding protein